MSSMYGLLEEDASRGYAEQDDSMRLTSVPTPPRRRTEWFAIGFLATALVVGVILFVVHHDDDESDHSSSYSCYLAPSCPADRTAYDPATGFTNNTGWASSTDHSCCDMCLEGTPPVVCFNETTCGDKTGLGDYDYLLMDHISLQQMCRGMAAEYPFTRHDPTLTHLSSSHCSGDAEKESYMHGLGLSIHGLWPNYVDGYPQCCGESEPLDPFKVTKYDIWPALQARWKDPSLPSDLECEPCYMLNHEWQKHGTCMAVPQQRQEATGKGVDAVYAYFDLALQIDTAMGPSLQAFNEFSGVIPLATIQDLFDHQVQVLCDPFDQPNNATHARFVELRTCWQMQDDVPVLMDCPAAFSSTFGAPCPEQVVLTTSQAM